MKENTALYYLASAILVFALAGCLNFDFSGPLIKYTPDPPPAPSERVHWVDYEDEYVRTLPFEHEGCILFYAKNELSCGECDRMDMVFKNQDIVYLLNNDFLPIEATDDLPDWEKAVARLGVEITPMIIVFDSAHDKVLFAHEGTAVPEKVFLEMLFGASKKCKE